MPPICFALERQDTRYFPSIREYTLLYGLDLPMLKSLDKELVIMHPGPINREQKSPVRLLTLPSQLY